MHRGAPVRSPAVECCVFHLRRHWPHIQIRLVYPRGSVSVALVFIPLERETIRPNGRLTLYFTQFTWILYIVFSFSIWLLQGFENASSFFPLLVFALQTVNLSSSKV